MRYGTWKIDFSENPIDGFVPYELEGVLYIGKYDIAGYLPESLIVDDYAQYSLVEITAEQMLELAIAKNPEATMVDGKIVTPNPYPFVS